MITWIVAHSDTLGFDVPLPYLASCHAVFVGTELLFRVHGHFSPFGRLWVQPKDGT